jgi:methylenetetrahydrofolate reductase (NADH)
MLLSAFMDRLCRAAACRPAIMDEYGTSENVFRTNENLAVANRPSSPHTISTFTAVESVLPMNAELRIEPEPTAPDLAASVRRLARAVSTEIAPHDEKLLGELRGLLPPGTSVYVAHTPRACLEDVVRVAIEVQSLGWTAWPHLVARRLPSERALLDALRELRASGIEQALLVAGDLERPAGPFRSTLEVIDAGPLSEAGFNRIGVAGHPEGHPAVSPGALLAALRHKQEFADRTGMEVHIVTQFGFDLEAVKSWARWLADHGVSLPVHVGIAGPTPLPRLLKFAMQCGVRHSMHALASRPGAISLLTGHTAAPDELLVALARDHALGGASRLVRPHFFSFGGALATAAWLRAIIDGEFELRPDGKGLRVQR